MKLKQVTITGADDSIDPTELFKITDEYPFVEWGILLSKSSTGGNRFPSLGWIEQLLAYQASYGEDKKIKLSGHLCGRWVRDICGGGFEFYDEMRDSVLTFQRFQLNFHSYIHKITSIPAFVEALLVLAIKGQQVIFQFDNVNNSLLTKANQNGVDAVALYDLSGGAGILPESWERPIGNYCGYAGGLSPDNLQRQLELLKPITGEHPIWIDAETHLRSDNDRQFDLNKVRRFLEIAGAWVTK